MMAAKTVKKELLNDDIKEFGEDAATAINELLGLYGYVGAADENKRNELNAKLHHRESCKKIANISQRLLEAQRRSKTSTMSSESEKSKINDYSSMSSDKEEDLSSSRENSKSPPQRLRHNNDDNTNCCSWCHQDISAHSTEIIGNAGTLFCSENCFSLWRRASFKRAKTCDFCKNVRNAVSYVDFNDGATQLQFCSDKCLNQYKMQIFCRETQAHLDLNPHLREKVEVVGASENLITPELWLKNCRSRSPTPASEAARPGSVSRTPTPNATEKSAKLIQAAATQPLPSATITSANTSLANLSSESSSAAAKKPLINVLPSSKLLSRSLLHQKSLRKRARITARMSQQQQHPSSKQQQSSDKNFSSDLRAQIPPPPPQQQIPSSGNFNHHRPPPLKFMPRPPINLFKFRPSFPANFLQQQQQPQPGQRMPPPPPSADNHPNMTMNSHHHHFLPPPVVLVPHPIVLPIIIPVPLPLSAFWNAYQVSSAGKHSTTKITSTTPPSSSSSSSLSSSEVDNEQQRIVVGGVADNHRVDEEELSIERAVQASSEEQPLDYTTSKSPETDGPVRSSDADDVPMNGGGGGEEANTIVCERMETSSNGNNSDKITEFKITTRQTLLKRCQQDNEPTTMTTATTFLKDYVNESSRPLRKRRIIAEVDNLSESP